MTTTTTSSTTTTPMTTAWKCSTGLVHVSLLAFNHNNAHDYHYNDFYNDHVHDNGM